MRSLNSLRNISYGVGGQLLSNILSFVNRTVFIYTIGISYLGITGLFSNIFSLLSLAELGVGSAISYSLYKPLAEHDIPKIQALMNLYAKSYRLIALIIAVAGLVTCPFIEYIIKDCPDIPYLKVYYLLMLSSTVVSYLFTYKRTIFICDQKAYRDTRNKYFFLILQTILQSVSLLLLGSFTVYLLIATLATFVANLAISYQADKAYPYIREKAATKIDQETKQTIIKNVIAMMMHKISGIIVYSSDNIILSAFLGLEAVGLYSNYYLIMNIITVFLNQIFTAITASVAELYVTGNVEQKREVYHTIYFINFWIVLFCSLSFYFLLNPFVTLWLGDKFLLDNLTVAVLCFYYYNQNMRHTVGTFKNTAGLYWNDRFKPIFESVINIVSSIVLLKFFGIAGVFMGTIVSLMTTSFWVEPFIVYKHVLKMKFRFFLLDYLKYYFFSAVIFGVVFVLNSFVPSGGVIPFIIRCFICLIVPNAMMLIMFRKSKRFKRAVSFLSPVLSKLGPLGRKIKKLGE